jgi:hypothetical protein
MINISNLHIQCHVPDFRGQITRRSSSLHYNYNALVRRCRQLAVVALDLEHPERPFLEHRARAE